MITIKRNIFIVNSDIGKLKKNRPMGFINYKYSHREGATGKDTNMTVTVPVCKVKGSMRVLGSNILQNKAIP